MALNITHKPYTAPISFQKRVTVKDENGNVPLSKLFFEYRQVKLAQPKFQPSQLEGFHNAIMAHIRKIQDFIGPIHPTNGSGESNITNTQAISGDVLDISSQIKADNRNYEGDIESKFVAAGKAIGKEMKNEIQALNSKVMSTSVSSPEFIDRIIETNDFFVNGIKFEINSESGRIDEIAKSDEAVIFIANHYKTPYDVCLTHAFCSELYKSYKEHGKTTGYPLPKMIVDKIFMKGLPEGFREVYKKVEGVGTQLSPYPIVKGSGNDKILNPILEGFVNNSNHIITFPEGRRAFYTGKLPLEHRFDNDIAQLILKALDKKGKVKVVSLGLDYDAENKFGSVHVGKPIYFAKDGKQIVVTKGNITQDSQAAKENSFYSELSKIDDQETMKISLNGEPQELTKGDKGSHRLMSRLISGILCTDFDICAKKAQETLKKEIIKGDK